MKTSTCLTMFVGAPDECASILYLTGLSGSAEVVLLRTPGEDLLVVSGLDHTRAEQTVAGHHRPGGGRCRVLSADALILSPQDRQTRAAWALALLRLRRRKRILVPEAFPLAVADHLRRHGVRVDGCRGDAVPERAVKSALEIRKLRESQQAGVIAVRAVRMHLSRSEIGPDRSLRLNGALVTSAALRALVRRMLLEHECFCRDVIVAGGPTSADPHAPGCGPLKAGEPIVIDVFPRHLVHGYWGDIARTVVRGEAPQQVKRMHHAVRAAQQAALSVIRPGVMGSTVYRAAVAELRRRGFAAAGHAIGHGIGLSLHESPSLSMSDRRLRSGHVVAVEPGLYDSAVGGVRIEDAVVVTPSGWKYLAPCETDLEI